GAPRQASRSRGRGEVLRRPQSTSAAPDEAVAAAPSRLGPADEEGAQADRPSQAALGLAFPGHAEDAPIRSLAAAPLERVDTDPDPCLPARAWNSVCRHPRPR